MTAPSPLELAFRGWHAAWPVTAVAVVVGVAYLLAVRRIQRPWPWRRSAAFLAGIATLVVALQSGLDSYDGRLLSAHMVQHLVLMDIAPLLLLLGCPLLLMLRVLHGAGRRRFGRFVTRVGRYASPSLCLALYTVVLLALHLPAVFDATLRNATLHEFDHLAFLGAGLLLWWPLHAGEVAPGRHLGGFGRLVYVLIAMVPLDLLGALLNRDTTVLYAAYRGPAHALGVSAVTDQQIAGALMWVAGSTVMVVVGLWCALRALVLEERRMKSAEARS